MADVRPKKKAASARRAPAARKKPAHRRERVTLDDWRALVRDVVRARTAAEARAIHARHMANGREWELPALLDASDEDLSAFGQEAERALGERIKAVKAGGELWST